MPTMNNVSVIFTCILVMLALPQCIVAAEPSKTVLLKETFDDNAEEGIARILLKSPAIERGKGKGVDGTDAIMVSYVGFEKGSKRVTGKFPLKDKVDHAILSYDVKFMEDFQWVAGGKLHGLCPKKSIAGGKPKTPEDWSVRVVFKDHGKCKLYIYDQGDTKYGIGPTTTAVVFKKSKWHHVELEVKLNTPDKADGFARIKVDGKLVLEKKEIRFRGAGGRSSLIQQFLFSTFHGGHSPAHAPVEDDGRKTTVHALFDNFMVTTPVGIQ